MKPICYRLFRLTVPHRIMWSMDFPHIVTRWPHSLQLVKEQFGGVPEDEKRKMLAGNAVKYFHLDR